MIEHSNRWFRIVSDRVQLMDHMHAVCKSASGRCWYSRAAFWPVTQPSSDSMTTRARVLLLLLLLRLGLPVPCSFGPALELN